MSKKRLTNKGRSKNKDDEAEKTRKLAKGISGLLLLASLLGSDSKKKNKITRWVFDVLLVQKKKK